MKDIEEVKRGAPVNPVEALASKALDAVMVPERDERRIDEGPASYETQIAVLAEAFRSDDPNRRRLVVGEILSGGTDAHEFISSHVVDTAYLLGELWYQNKISFADVTIGAARLQETVRRLAASRHAVSTVQPGPEILLTAPKAEDHLLSLFVASEAFEALGCYVHLAIGKEPDELAKLAEQRHFDMVGISIGSNRMLNGARAISKRLHRGSSQSAPIVLGGSLASNTLRHRELLEETGADHVTSCPKEALSLCQIKVHQPVGLKIAQT